MKLSLLLIGTTVLIPPSDLTSSPSNPPVESYESFDCCLEECCSLGTTWDSLIEYCVKAINSSRFNDEYSRPDFGDGFMEWSCCKKLVASKEQNMLLSNSASKFNKIST
jgi:hypothetical protein